jgi:predicted short-subunit dehydrogenase-like oxidoreductase (DUF2520 family)
MEKQKIKVSVIGSGNVATHLAAGLFNAGVSIVSVWSPSRSNRMSLAAAVNAGAVENLGEINGDSDYYIISVPDDKIEEVIRKLPVVDGIVCHTSGITSIDVFAEKFDHYGVFYPLQTFSKKRSLDLKEVPFCLEGNNEESLLKLKLLAGLISQNIYEVSSENRMFIHLSAVFVSNFVNYMYTAAHDILKRKDLPFDLLKPLIKEVAAKVQELAPSEAQTGPARRKDLKTIEKHQDLLGEMDKDYLEIYKIITSQIIKKYHEL